MSNCYVATLTIQQIPKLQKILTDRGWKMESAPYAHWRARKDSVNVIAYESGKLTVQGKGMEDFIQFILEPDILHEARYGYEDVLAEKEHPEMFEPHAGIDESGKGDYFGPLCVACCFTTADSARALRKAGVADSKTISSDKKIAALAEIIRGECSGHFAILTVRPEAYNRIYKSFLNLNRMLAWGHARVLENLLERVPECPRAISDQFGNPAVLRRSLQERGRKIILEQYPRAEQDIAVAAASILARNEFVCRITEMQEKYQMTFPKGAGPAVLQQARIFLQQHDSAELGKIAKLHFKTTGLLELT